MSLIVKSLNQIAEFCGFKTNAEKGYDAQKHSDDLLSQETKGANPLADSLLYDYCDDQTGIFFNKGSLGAWFEIEPIIGTHNSIEKNLKLFFSNELPENIYIQFLAVASHDIDHILDLWKSGRKYGGEALKHLTKYREHFIKNLSIDFKNASDGILPRNFRFFVTLSMKDNGPNTLETMMCFRQKVLHKLKTEKFCPRICYSQDLVIIIRDLLQMPLKVTKNQIPKYNILNNLSEQVLDSFVRNRIEDDQILHQDTDLASKILAPTELPESFSLIEMINLLGNENRSIPGRFVISYIIANNINANERSKIEAAAQRSMHAARQEYTKNDLIAHEHARQWIEVMALSKKGEIFLQESVSVMITAPNNQMDSATEALTSLFNTYDWKLKTCTYIQRVASLAILPMMQSSYWKMLKFFKLTKLSLSGDVVAKLPIQGEWKGVPQSGALLIGRRGQLFNFNPFFRIGGGGNYNICMMAPSGAGKSFLLEEIVQSMMSLNVAIFVLDIGASYKNIANLFDGELVRFNHETDLSLNPFATLSGSGAVYSKALTLLKKKKNIEEIAKITDLAIEKIEALALGQKSTSDSRKELDAIEILEIPSRVEKGKIHFVTKDSIIYAKSMLSAMCAVVGDARSEALIEKSIQIAIAIYGNDLDISILAKVLSEMKDHSGKEITKTAEMADSLYPYTEQGIHGRFFKAGKEASFTSGLTVFELEELQNDKPLLAVILQVILMQITMQFLCGDRQKKFMLVVDEAWMILDFSAAFLERFSRTVRKYGGSLVVCTQDLNSFTNKCGTRNAQQAILESSTWKLILQQNADGLKSFSESINYQKYLELIQSIRKCPANKFSEVMIQTDGATVVGRFAADPYSVAAFSTEADDFNMLAQMEKAGYSKHEAIMKLSKKYGKLPEIE